MHNKYHCNVRQLLQPAQIKIQGRWTCENNIRNFFQLPYRQRLNKETTQIKHFVRHSVSSTQNEGVQIHFFVHNTRPLKNLSLPIHNCTCSRILHVQLLLRISISLYSLSLVFRCIPAGGLSSRPPSKLLFWSAHLQDTRLATITTHWCSAALSRRVFPCCPGFTQDRLDQWTLCLSFCLSLAI